jgi:predicted deacylase
MVARKSQGIGGMRYRIAHTKLHIGKIGTLPIDVPIVQLGSGTPHLAIMCGVHGDETASLVISHLFLKRLLQKAFNGTISIITAANPFAQSTRTRVSWADYYDLNRTGQGKPDGVFSERLAYKLVEFLSGCSFVIDIHEFEMNTPTMSIYIPSDKDDVDKQILNTIAVFKPSSIWAMNLSTTEEAKYSESLLSVLINRGIPGFAIETTVLASLTLGTIEKVVDGLMEVSKYLGIIDGVSPKKMIPIAYTRNVKYSDFAGIWIPTNSLMAEVKVGDKIGELVMLDLINKIDVCAIADGTLIQLRANALVDTGINLFTIGVKDLAVIEKLKINNKKTATQA